MSDTSTTLAIDFTQPGWVDDVLTPAALAEYWERGYWISPKLFDDDQIARLRAATQDQVRGLSGSRALNQR